MKKSFSYSIAAFTHCYIALCRVEASESSEAPESTQTPVPTQSVSVEFDTEQALTQEPAGEAQVSDDGTAIEYETTDGANVEESFDLTAEITDTETDGEGNLTDITYDVSLDRQTENGTDTTVTENVDQVWAAEGSEGADTGMGDRVVVRRDESTLTITDEENVQLSFELDGLKAEAESSVHINYSKGVVTIYLDSAEVFKVEVTEAVKANKEITFRLENGVLKLFDKSGRLIQEIEM